MGICFDMFCLFVLLFGVGYDIVVLSCLVF